MRNALLQWKTTIKGGKKMQNMFSIKDIKNKVSSNDLVYDNISTHWGNGMFVGGGSIGAISYSRNNL